MKKIQAIYPKIVESSDNNGHPDGATQAAISQSTIVVRDQDWQKHDIAAGAMGASIVELTGMIALELKGVTAGELSGADK